MKMNNKEWYKNNRTLLALVESVYGKNEKNMDKMNYIYDYLYSHCIENITFGDIKNYIIKKLRIRRKCTIK